MTVKLPEMTDEEANAELVRITKVAARRKVAILALTFFFVAASTLGIQLSNREQAKARADQLQEIQEQSQQIEELVKGAESIPDAVDEILIEVNCEHRRALQDLVMGLEEEGVVQPGSITLLC